ncbi:MAG: 16S rRNA (cytidine(1402)-2'-O)-methyltransferase [Exilibacterium sp.]
MTLKKPMTDNALYVVATPIGNLADMVPRAIETLQTVDVIAAEDTRHSARLLEHFHISTPMLAYHEYSGEQRAEQLVERLRRGESIALISDAGTPLVSDPGYRLVKAAREQGINVVPVPGACAAIAALSAAGLPSDRFVFEGFLPARQGARKNRLQSLARESRTLIFYEAPHRITACLGDMATIFGVDREVVLAREMTKTYETIESGTLERLLEFVKADKNQQRGEIVILVRGVEKSHFTALDEESQRIMAVLLEELPVKQAASLAARLTGRKKSLLYNWAIETQ